MTDGVNRFRKVPRTEGAMLSFPQRAAQVVGGFGANGKFPSVQIPSRESLTLPPALEDSACMYVESERGVREVIDDLSETTEFGVDVEYKGSSDVRSGFVCLVQISTPQKDYIIDAMKCHRWIFLLRPYFLKPHTTKILHGASADLRWLLTNFGIYVCNLFDTSIAMRQLCLPHCSLAYLLAHYCGVHVDKSIARHDWSIRPLPRKMLAYARTDVHYLSYCRNRLLCDLSAKNFPTGILRDASAGEKCPSDLVRNTQLLSHQMCLKAYEVK
ncbi:xosome subunit Rrp6P [Perkinsela sp. CCAP 1560/4]|nr:xosome subunit Rrp6P [Perkinsela sp. CCAP 1560/4]|eukprot:KNH06488.1 xosome subunit Rrp6P [Perkinsela sp. CCAP 1560/4]